MRLRKVTIEGYRSIKEPLTLVFDPLVTVLLGANDHGKTNILDALLHLDPDKGFDSEDVNWDLEAQQAAFPEISYELALTEDERAELARMATATRRREAATTAREEAVAAQEELEAPAADAASEAASAIQAEQTAQTEFEAARTAIAASDTEETRAAVVEAQQRLDAAAQVVRDTEESRVTAEGRLHRSRLAVSLADARSLEADALLAGSADTVAAHADAAEARAQAAATAVRRAQTKSERAAEAATKAAGDAAALEKAEADVQVASTQLKTAQADAAVTQQEAERLRAAADALELVTRGDQVAKSADVGAVDGFGLTDVPEALLLSRTGMAGMLTPAYDALPEQALASFLESRLPRVQLIAPTPKIPDSVSRQQLSETGHVFMRGIFEYAGLSKDEWDDIFPMNDRTRMRLEEASLKLNETLRASWSQGEKLNFALRHDSKSGKIDLLIRDPAIGSRFARPSRRSSGFTHFFGLKTILHGLQREVPASSYIWVFDEPGIYLHPDGQRDLIQVMETLARQNQVVYATHSIFLANKNFPTRHRLVVKSERGTTLDSKPFASRWRAALESLGLSLPGTVLFSSHVLLVEGDSDAILINATLRKLIALGRLDLDLNALAVIATGDAQNGDALIRILSESGPAGQAPTIGVLVDGDSGGEARLKVIEKLVSDRGIKTDKLMSGTTTEDHIPAAKSLYIEALAGYLAEMKDLNYSDTLSKLRKSFEDKFPNAKEVTAGISGWSREAAKEVAGLDDKPSPVGVARAYSNRLDAADADELKGQHALERAFKLANWIQQELAIPGQTLTEETIIED